MIPSSATAGCSIQIFQKGEKIRLQKGLAAGEMDAGLPVPPADRAQKVVGDFGKLRKGEIRTSGKILLVAMAAAQVAEIGEVPLDIKIFHKKMVAEAPADGKEEKETRGEGEEKKGLRKKRFLSIFIIREFIAGSFILRNEKKRGGMVP